MEFGVEEVIDRGMCVGCGACSVRTSGAIPVTIGTRGLISARLDGVSDDLLRQADRVCPFSSHSPNEDALASSSFAHLPKHDGIGRFRRVVAGRVARDETLMGSSSGGLTSFILIELLERGIVDGVIHVGRSDADLFAYRISRSAEDLKSNRKSMYAPSTLADVVEEIRGDGQRYAIVGVPCFITAARHLAREVPELADQFAFFVGLVCGHLKSRFFAESLAWQAGVRPDDLHSIDFRVKNSELPSNAYDYAVTSTTGTRVTHNIRDTVDGSWGYGAFQPEACNYCDDVYGETADVTLGDAWLPRYENDWRGTNVAVIRNETVLSILEDGAASRQLIIEDLEPAEAVAAQAGNFRHRHLGLRVRLADDIAEGLPVPTKRVEPGYAGVSRTRVSLIRIRRAISQESLLLFERAREARNLDVYLRGMARLRRKYNLVDAAGRGPRAFTRKLIALCLGRGV